MMVINRSFSCFRRTSTRNTSKEDFVEDNVETVDGRHQSQVTLKGSLMKSVANSFAGFLSMNSYSTGNFHGNGTCPIFSIAHRIHIWYIYLHLP